MPTLKQKKAIKNASENLGKPLGEIMRESGYSESTSLSPKNLTETKAWQDFLKEHLPDQLLATRHEQLLNKREVIITQKGNKKIIEITDQPHSDVKQALDMAYKLKGSYAPEKQVQIKISLKQLLDASKR